ncbi:MAG: conjugal transfer protein TraF [Sideroxydans sp.]
MKRKILLAALLGAMGSAHALDTTYDARSLGMAGTGAASANSLNAAYQNPAALASLPDEDFILALPVLSLRVLDADSLSSDLDTLDSSANALSDALNRFQNDVNANNTAGLSGATGSAANAAAALDNFNNALNLVSNKALAAGAFGGTLLAIPSAEFSFALAADARAEMGGFFNYASSDSAQISSISTDLGVCAANPTANVANCNAVNGQVSGGQLNSLNSTFELRGAVLKEAGITAARHFADWGEIDLGITPKFINLSTYDVSSNAQSGNSNTSLNNGEKKETMFTFDLGVSRTGKTDGGNVIKAGLVAKNILAKKTTTINGNAVEIAPQLTAGVAYSGSWFTTTADLDVLKNKSMLVGLNPDARFLRLGAELDAWGWAQFRLGYRHDLAGNYDGLPSVGVGLFHILDLSVAAASKKEAAVAMQLGIRF